MKMIDYKAAAEQWLDHVVRQYGMIHVCRQDLARIELLLERGFTLRAVRDQSKVLRVDFLRRRRFKTSHARRMHRRKHE
jgi:hypothetical protein